MGEGDNEDVIVLPHEVFIQLAGEEPIEEVDIRSWVNASNMAHKKTIHQWANSHQLRCEHDTWWKDMALVVAGGNNLKWGVISTFHDPPYRSHPGIANTYNLLKRDYWWPTARRDTEEYVKGCAICQADKINTHHQKPHLFPITTNPKAQPFKVVTMDFITKLPLSNCYVWILNDTPRAAYTHWSAHR